MNRFTFTMMIYQIDYYLDKMLNDDIKSGIKKITKENNYYIIIEFNSGTIYYMWDENKYYAWLSDGMIYKNNDTKKPVYTWKSTRPAKKTMALLLRKIKRSKNYV